MQLLRRRTFLAALVRSFGGLALARSVPARALAPQQPGSIPWFTDVASRSSFAYRTNNDFTGRKYFPQPMCGGIAAIDYDNDGWMDLFFTNGAKLPELKKTGPAFANCLLRNNRDGTFTDVTAKAGLEGMDLGFCFGVAAADYDNDGHTDLFIANAGRNALYHNNGDGTFTDVTAGSGLDRKPENLLSVGAAWFDFDNDGLLDLIVTNYTFWSPLTDKQCFMDAAHEEYCSPTVYKSVASRLYRNLGHGKFEDVTDSSALGRALGKGMGISIADFNGDGRMDIFIANDTEPNFLFLNQGNGTFKEVGLEYGVAYNPQGDSVSGMGCDANDFDNDGWVDIVYNDLQGQVFGLLHNEAGKSFNDVTWSSKLGPLSRSLSGWSIGFIDYNNDGWKDIYSANGDVDNLTGDARQHDTMFQNLDGKILRDASPEMGPDFNFKSFQRGSAFVDLNNDGFMDLVVTSLGEKPRILMNNGVEKNHWLLLNLRGKISNRDAIGATVKLVTASGRTLYNHVNPSVGFMSSSDRRVHFGLGAEAALAYLEIRWPSGIVQRIDHPAADRIHTIEESDAK
ncbi:MAG: CRTAC1 family protein [Terracidiphilus sp.]|nr:CRTAC1 family protein [Terracidiphilus sp.]